MFVSVCRSSNGELYANVLEVTPPRFHFASPSSSPYICLQAPGVTKTWTSIYEVSFPLEETMGDKVLPL